MEVHYSACHHASTWIRRETTNFKASQLGEECLYENVTLYWVLLKQRMSTQLSSSNFNVILSLFPKLCKVLGSQEKGFIINFETLLISQYYITPKENS